LNGQLKFYEIQHRDIKSGALLVFKDKETKTEIEVTVNKILEVYNSKLLHTYSIIDQRFS